MSHDEILPYRKSAGVCLFNNEGQVLIAERLDHPNSWQWPQGGINEREAPDEAVFREMKEEIGTSNARIIGRVLEPLRYDFPPYIPDRHKAFKGKYRGQEQTWFAMLFLGNDDEINLASALHDEPIEFRAWRWIELREVPAIIVAFKRPIYECVVECFAPLVERIKAGDV